MYIIAQHAAEGFWEHHYDVDPNLTGLHPVHSVHHTVEGSTIKPFYKYDEFKEAVNDCNRLNNMFHKKGYAVVRSL